MDTSAPTANPGPSPTAIAPALHPPITIDVGNTPLAVLTGLPMQLTPTLEGTDSVRWRLAAEDEGHATLTPDGLFTGRVPGSVLAIAEAEGGSASVRIAILSREVITPNPVALRAIVWKAGFLIVRDEESWRRFWSTYDDSGTFSAYLPPFDFERSAVLVYTTEVDGEGNPRLRQPGPVMAATSPRIQIVFPERQSIFNEMMASAADTGYSTYFWAIPRTSTENEIVTTQWGRVGVPVPWSGPAPVVSPRPSPSPSQAPLQPVAEPSASRLLAIEPKNPCPGSEVSVTGSGFRSSAVTLELRAFASGQSLTGTPLESRPLVVLPVREDGGFAFRFTLPAAPIAPAEELLFPLKPENSYLLWCSEGRSGQGQTLRLCGEPHP